jgi:hypothetical protein
MATEVSMVGTGFSEIDFTAPQLANVIVANAATNINLNILILLFCVN